MPSQLLWDAQRELFLFPSRSAARVRGAPHLVLPETGQVGTVQAHCMEELDQKMAEVNTRYAHGPRHAVLFKL
jgi:hypothetical protein